MATYARLQDGIVAELFTTAAPIEIAVPVATHLGRRVGHSASGASDG